MFVSLMQLYDILFWLYLSKNKINYWTTKIAMITNHLQPIILALLILYIAKKKLNIYILGILVLYIIAFIIYSYIAWNKISYTLVDSRSEPSLFWEWNNLDGSISVLFYGLYLLLVCALFYNGFEWPLNFICIGIVLVSYVLSFYYYKGQTSVGRFWCYFAGYIPLLLIIYFII
jgi:small-conductance mechanosensitive channel